MRNRESWVAESHLLSSPGESDPTRRVRLSNYASSTVSAFHMCDSEWSIDHITGARRAPTMFRDWTKLWEEDVERVWGSFKTGKWLWWVCRRRRAEIAGVLKRLPLANGRRDDGSVSAESGVDGARWSVDHSNSGITTTESATNSSTTADDSNGTSATAKASTFWRKISLGGFSSIFDRRRK